MRILLDMDEVLVDFVGGALQIHGWTVEQLDAVCPPGVWSIVEPMGLTPNQFWSPIQRVGSAFWLGLKPLPWADCLVAMISDLTDDWHIVSSPSSGGVGCYTGKTLWLKQYFGQTFDRFVITPHKHILARSGVILIDDREETIDKFNLAGGCGVLFPSPRNRLHRYSDNLVDYGLIGWNCWLQQQLQERRDALSLPQRK